MMDTIKLKGLKFNFRNLRTYPEEGTLLIEHFRGILPLLEDYLKDMKILPDMQDKLWGSDNYVFVWITQDIVPTKEGILLGCVGALKKSENMVIEIRVPPKSEKKDYIILFLFFSEILCFIVNNMIST